MSSSNLNLDQAASVQIVRAADKGKGGAQSLFGPRGSVEVEHWRDGLLIGIYRFKNGIVNEGKNHLLSAYFDIGGGIDIVAISWYMLLVDNAAFSALADADTYDDIDQAGNGWDEFKDYTDPSNGDSTVTRPPWNPDAASGQSISNTSQTIYDITAGGTVKGIGIVGAESGATASPSTKGDNAADGILWATALFDQGDTAVVNGDQLKVTYTVNT